MERMGASVLGSTDVELVERIFQRIMSEGPVLMGGTRPRGRGYSQQNITFPKSAGYRQSHHQVPSSHSQRPGTLSSSENRFPYRYHSVGPLARRQMAQDCGLKSISYTTGRSWTHGERLDTRSNSQSSIYLEAPDGHVTPRKGLSGSKVRHSAQVSSRPNSRIQHQGGEHSGTTTPTTSRPCSFRRNEHNSVALVDEEESEHGLISNYRWNSSEQGQRLQSHLSGLTSGRAMKRASEMVQHRLDPMYLMSGNKVVPQNRYGIDDNEMQRLREMTQIREDLMSDLKKMKFPYKVKSSAVSVKKAKPTKTAFNTPRSESLDRNGNSSETKRSKPRLASASSEPSLNKIEEQPPSQHSDSDDNSEDDDQ